MSADPSNKILSSVDFPSLVKAAEEFDKERGLRYSQHLLNGIVACNEAMTTGSIRNAIYNDVKHTFGMLISKAWDRERGFQYRAETDAWQNVTVLDSMGFLYMSSLVDVRRADTKLSKVEAKGYRSPTLRVFIDELMPLVLVVEGLKDKVVKGRAPSKGPAKPVNPDKDVKTCPCCLRAIAVREGKMVHHGYNRPGDGYQTPSCYGIEYPPLEISTEGLEWMIGFQKQTLEGLQKSLSTLPNSDKITTFNGVRSRTYVKGDKDFAHALDNAMYELRGNIRLYQEHIKYLSGELQKWREYHANMDEIPDAPRI